MKVFGISFDSPEENRAFAEKFDFPFPLLCDTDRHVGVAYGACDAPDAKHARRITYVISPQGHVERAIETEDPAGQAQELLQGLAPSGAAGEEGSERKGG